jgi:hypothetical protein
LDLPLSGRLGGVGCRSCIASMSGWFGAIQRRQREAYRHDAKQASETGELENARTAACRPSARLPANACRTCERWHAGPNNDWFGAAKTAGQTSRSNHGRACTKADKREARNTNGGGWRLTFELRGRPTVGRQARATENERPRPVARAWWHAVGPPLE